MDTIQLIIFKVIKNRTIIPQSDHIYVILNTIDTINAIYIHRLDTKRKNGCKLTVKRMIVFMMVDGGNFVLLKIK